MQVPLLVNDFLRRAAKLYPDKLAIVDEARRCVRCGARRTRPNARLRLISTRMLTVGLDACMCAAIDRSCIGEARRTNRVSGRVMRAVEIVS